MRGAPPGTSILLCHRPYYFPQAAERSIDLVLSGHTHGGQVVFGQVGDAILTPAALASRYVWGEYRIGKASMYVSRGIGTVGVPIRINCPPEITLLTLERSPGPLSSLGSTEAADRQALSNLAFPRGV
jgi:predicted MPP superfamily phosphohydrolase